MQKIKDMSFALTPDQMIARTKFVTRRFGYLNVKPGDQFRAIYKMQGLKKGEKRQPIIGADCNEIIIEVTSVHREPVNAITGPDVVKEGFPWLSREGFISMLCKSGGKKPDDECTRIEFIYVDQV